MPFTGMLGGLLGIQAFEQEQAQQRAQIEDAKAQVQQRQLAVQQSQLNMGMQKAQQDVITNFLKQGVQERTQEQTQQQQAQRQQAQVPQEDRMIALGKELFDKGFTDKGASLIKEGSKIKHQRVLEQKNQALERKQSLDAAKLETLDRGKALSGLGDTPSKEVYQETMKQINEDTGKVPDWYTGDYTRDKPFIDREVKSYKSSNDSHMAHMQNGQTANAYYGLAEKLNTQATTQAKPIVASMERTALIRTLLSGKSTPAKDQQIRDALTNLTSANRQGAHMYEKNTHFGNLAQRLEQSVEGFITGKITDAGRKQLAGLVDELDNNLYKPEFFRIEKGYKDRAQKMGIPPEMVSPIDPTGFQDKPAREERAKATAAKASAPPRALEYLKAHPESIRSFEEHYGFRPAGF